MNQICSAEVDFKSLKGTREFIGLKEECDYLAPEIPLGLIRQGKLNQVYHYGDDHDPSVRLVQTAFNSVSENPAFFQISPLARNIARLLPPSVIGKILAKFATEAPSLGELKSLIVQDEYFQRKVSEVAERKKQAQQNRDEYLAHSPLDSSIKALRQELQEKKEHFQKIKSEKRKELIAKPFPEGLEGCTAAARKGKLDEIAKKVEEEIKLLYQEIQGTENRVSLLKERLDQDERLQKLTSAVDQFNYQEKYLDGFLELLLRAVEAGQSPKSRTPKHTAEQVLLSIGWLNGESKQDFAFIYEQLPRECFTEQGLQNLFSQKPSDVEKRSRWLKDFYSEADYQEMVKRLMRISTHDRAQYFLAHPDELAFLYYGRPLLDGAAFPTMGFKQVDFTHPVTLERVHMPDCMEYAILNKILNDLAGRPGNQFDVSTLERNLRSLGYEMHPGLQAFLAQYPDPSRINEIDAHRKWAELVSGLPRVKYNPLHPSYEIIPTVSNALEVFEHLLFHKKMRNDAISFSSLESVQKFNLICQVLSREGKRIDWDFLDAFSEEEVHATAEDSRERRKADTNLVLVFSFNGVPKYNWTINSNHSQVDPIKDDGDDWRTGVGPKIANRIMNSKRLGTQDRRILAWFLDTSDLTKIFSELYPRWGDPDYDEFLQNVPLDSVDNKLFVIGGLAKSGRVAEIKKIHAKLPSDDALTQRRYHAILADHQYPFDSVSKTLAGAEYTFIPNHPVLGRSWRDPRGMVWGNAVSNSHSGGDERMYWVEAKNFCLSLNPSGQARLEVQRALDFIEYNGEMRRLRASYLDSSPSGVYSAYGREKARDDLLKKYREITQNPIPGCFLPPLEEYLLLREDLGDGRENNLYMPQLLSHLYGYDFEGKYRWFWSSSPFSEGVISALGFDGSTGSIEVRRKSYKALVRCVCSSAPQ